MRGLRTIINWLTFPLRWWFITTPSDEKVVNSFVDWFGSVPGFKQQFLFMTGWLLIDIVYPHIDPNKSNLYGILTYYSGVTQPMIAIQNAYSAHKQNQLLKNNIHQMQAMVDIITHVQKGSEQNDSSS